MYMYQYERKLLKAIMMGKRRRVQSLLLGITQDKDVVITGFWDVNRFMRSIENERLISQK